MVLPLIWAAIVAFVIIMYVLLDGFDLGIGILYPLVPEESHRDLMMNTVAPVWDGNETWLVLGGALLYGAFPIVYSTLLPTFYMPIMIMLFSLIFRGIAFEFRFKAHSSKKVWNIAFICGSILASFMQGMILGTFVEGYALTQFEINSASLAWINPFSIMTGFAVVVGYGLLGATWLIKKTEGELQERMYRFAKLLLIGLFLCIVAVSIWTPLVASAIRERWYSIPNIYYLSIMPILTVIAFLYAYKSLKNRQEKTPFVLCISLFLLAYAGFAISIWPYIIPMRYTIWEAAAPQTSLIFMLVGAVILIPILIIYNIYQYRVFSGKIKADEGYH